jgi:hypothetical protein
MKAKGLLAIFVLLLILAIGLRGYAQPNEEEISTAFQDAVNFVLYPDEVGDVTDLFAYEIEDRILPKASEIMAKTISLVYERTGEDIGVVEVFAVLPPNIEEVLLPKKEEIKVESVEILESQALENQTKEE